MAVSVGKSRMESPSPSDKFQRPSDVSPVFGCRYFSDPVGAGTDVNLLGDLLSNSDIGVKFSCDTSRTEMPLKRAYGIKFEMN